MADSTLELEIKAEADKAESAIDTLITKLGGLSKALDSVGNSKNFKSFSGQANTISKEYSGIANSVSKSMQTTQSVVEKTNKSTEQSVKTLAEKTASYMEKYKDLGKDFKFHGSTDKLTSEIQKYENALEKAQIKKQAFELDSNSTGSEKMLENAIRDIQQYSNMIKSLKNQQGQRATKRDSVLSPEEEALFNKNAAQPETTIQSDLTSETEKAIDAVTDYETELEFAREKIDQLTESWSRYNAESQSSLKALLSGQDTTTKTDSGTEFKAIQPLKTSADFSNVYELQKYMDTLATKADNVSAKMMKLDALGANPSTQRYQGYVYDLEQIETTIQTLQPALEQLQSEGQLELNIPDLPKVNSQASALATTFKDMKIIVPTQGLTNVEKELAKVQSRYEQLRKSIQLNVQANQNYGASGTYKKQQVELEALRQEYNDLLLKQEQLSKIGGGGYSFSFSGLINGAKKAGESLKKLEIPKKLTSSLSKVKSLLSKITPSANSVSKGFKKLTSSSSKLLKGLTKLGKMLKLMIVRMALRSVISGTQEGFQNLAQYSSVVNADLSLLMNSLNQLKNSFAAAAAPILNVLTPVLNYLIQVIISAMNYINQFISTLLGKSSWTKALALSDSYADSLDSAASSAGSAASAVEDMLGLQGFDELNNLTTNDDSSGSGGSGSSSTDASDMFTEAEIDSDIANLANRIKEMWANQDYEGIGSLISDKLADMLESIDWDKIYSVASNFGKGLAEFLNGLIKPRTFAAIGKTLAGVLNTALVFLDSFGDNFDFSNFGESISTGIVSFLNSIKWDTALSAARHWGEGIGDTLNSFLSEDLFTSVGETLANLINTIAQAILSLGEKIDFVQLGKNIATGFKKFFRKFDWTKIKSAASTWGTGLGDLIENILGDKELFAELGTWIAEAINTALTFITSLDIDWQSVGEAIAEGFNKLISGLDTHKVAEGIDEFVGGLVDLVVGLISNINWAEVIGSAIDIVFDLDISTIGAVTLALAGPSLVKLIVSAITKKIGTKIAMSLGIDVATSTVSGAATAGANVSSSLLSAITTKLGSSTAISSIQTALTSALKVAGSAAAVAAAAVIGYEIGNSLYENVDWVHNLSNGIVESIGNFFTGQDISIDGTDTYVSDNTPTKKGVVGDTWGITSDTSAQDTYDILKKAADSGDTKAAQRITENADYFEYYGVEVDAINTAITAKQNWTAETEKQKSLASQAQSAVYKATLQTEDDTKATDTDTASKKSWIAETEKQKALASQTASETYKASLATSKSTSTTKTNTSTTKKATSATKSYVAETEKQKAIASQTATATYVSTLKTQKYTSAVDDATDATKSATSATKAWGEEASVEKTLNASTSLNGVELTSSTAYAAAVKQYSSSADSNWTDSSATANLTTQVNSSSKTSVSALASAVSSYSSSARLNWKNSTATFNTTTSLNGTVKSSTAAYGSAVNALSQEAKENWKDASNVLSTTTTLTLIGGNSVNDWANTNIINPFNERLSNLQSKLTTASLNSKLGYSSTLKIPTLATGGFVDKGQLFVANEAGAEMVGKMGNQTTVANNNQITEGIASAVSSANAEGNSLMRQEISLLQMQNSILTDLLEKDTGISADSIFNSVRKSATSYYKRTGKTAF